MAVLNKRKIFPVNTHKRSVRKRSPLVKKRSPPVKKRSFLVKKRSSPVKKRSSPVKKRSSPVKKRSSPVKKRSSLVKKRSSLAKKRSLQRTGSYKSPHKKSIKQTRVVHKKGSTLASLRKEYSKIPYSRRMKKKKLLSQIKKQRSGINKGSRTRGWGASSPQKGRERYALKAKCGNKCFLEPSSYKYPVCNKNCKYDCRGIISAKVRSRQYHNQRIASKAQNLQTKYCK
jgi:hypothetical protein